MDNSNRVHGTYSSSHCVPKQKYNAAELKDFNSRGNTTGLQNQDKSIELLRPLLMHMRLNILWKVLPSDNKATDSMTFASMDQRWKYCLPILIDLRYTANKSDELMVIKEKLNTLDLIPQESK